MNPGLMEREMSARGAEREIVFYVSMVMSFDEKSILKEKQGV